MTIEEYTSLFKETFRKHIIENPDIQTKIVDIDENDIKTNKGHGVGLISLKKKKKKMGTVFYMEDFAKKDPDGERMIELTEFINTESEKFYDQVAAATLSVQNGDASPSDDVIISAEPLSHTFIPDTSGFETIEDQICGIRIIMKKNIMVNGEPSNYYTPVEAITDPKKKAEYWKKAHDNTIQISDIIISPTNENGISYVIADRNSFADYFYLIDKDILEDICAKLRLKRMYIFSIDRYLGYILPIETIVSDATADIMEEKLLESKIMEDYLQSGNEIPPLKFNPTTGEFTNLKDKIN